MISPLQQQGIVRDYWGTWIPKSIELAAALNDPDCYRPAYYSAPPRNDQLVPARGYAQAQLALVAGSFIYGLLEPAVFTYRLQITDLATDHAWFNTPIEAAHILGRPWYLAAPYPVVGSGLFRLEFWNTDAAEARLQLVLCVAEPRSSL